MQAKVRKPGPVMRKPTGWSRGWREGSGDEECPRRPEKPGWQGRQGCRRSQGRYADSANTKANLRMQSQNGDVFTDFDVALRQQPAENSSGNKEGRSEGRYQVKVERGVFGAINGGGPEMSFKTFNGNIHLRRAGS